MTRLQSFADRIDYALLQTQKLTLLHLASVHDGHQRESLDGIIALIDELQDAVVADGIKAESDVFAI